MKYYEILIRNTTNESHYEGRFFTKAACREDAVKEVSDFLEINNDKNYKIYTRELTPIEYSKNIKRAEEKKAIANKLVENYIHVRVGSIPYNRVNKVKSRLEFVDLRDII